MNNKMKYENGGNVKGDKAPESKDGWFKRNMKELMTEFRNNHEDHGGDQKFYISNKAFLEFAKNKYNKIKKRVTEAPEKVNTKLYNRAKNAVKKADDAEAARNATKSYKTGGFLEPGIESID